MTFAATVLLGAAVLAGRGAVTTVERFTTSKAAGSTPAACFAFCGQASRFYSKTLAQSELQVYLLLAVSGLFMNPILDTARFLFTDLTPVTGVDQVNLKSWFIRESMEYGVYDRVATGKGTRALLTLRTVYEVAITAALVSLGLAPSVAFISARVFSNRTPHRLYDTSKNPDDGRNPSTLLFDDGLTFLTVSNIVDVKNETWIQRIQKTDPVETAFFQFFTSGRDAALIIYCNDLIEGVDMALDVRRG
jgi:hypothetical protein